MKTFLFFRGYDNEHNKKSNNHLTSNMVLNLERQYGIWSNNYGILGHQLTITNPPNNEEENENINQ
jgi:hypothetical protein